PVAKRPTAAAWVSGSRASTSTPASTSSWSTSRSRKTACRASARSTCLRGFTGSPLLFHLHERAAVLVDFDTADGALQGNRARHGLLRHGDDDVLGRAVGVGDRHGDRHVVDVTLLLEAREKLSPFDARREAHRGDPAAENPAIEEALQRA